MEGLAWRSDAELVQDVRRGDHEAFGYLVDRWFDEVMAEARAMVGDSEAAGEVATDTFHALWYHLDQLADAASFGAWAVDTSRTFAATRAASLPDLPPAERERHLAPLMLDPFQLRTVVERGLQLRGVPSALTRMVQAPALVGHAGGAIGGAVGTVGEATALMRVVGSGVDASPAGTGASAAPGPGGPLGALPDAVVPDHAVQFLGDVQARNAHERAHRYDAPTRRESRGLNLAPPRVAAGAVAAVALLIIAAVLWFTNRHEPAVASSDGPLAAVASTTSELSTTIAPAAPVACPDGGTTISNGDPCPAGGTTEPPPTEPTTVAEAPSPAGSSSIPPRSTTTNPPSTTRATTTTTIPTTTTTRATTSSSSPSTTKPTTSITSSTTTASTRSTTTTTTTRVVPSVVPVVGGPAGTATLGQ